MAIETTQQKLARLLAKARENQLAPAVPLTSSIPDKPTEVSSVDKYGNIIILNEKQAKAVSIAANGQSSIIIGAAGTGKTTCTREVVSALILSGYAGIYINDNHKHLTQQGAPGIVIVSFTRRAVSNIRKVMPENLKKNCLTIHALLEYEPVRYTIIDEETGEDRNTMKFEPTRNAMNPLPSTIRTVIVEESSMVSVELFKQLTDALPRGVQFIFLGDIQQLPPVFGAAILGFKMLELPVTELTEVYRQALESPIIRLAHRVLSGVPIPSDEFDQWNVPGKLKLHPWKKELSVENATDILSKFLVAAIDKGEYSPEEDMVLIPFNKSCGTIELNRHVANHLAKKRDVLVYEIVAGYEKHYYSVGDKVLCDKEDAIITHIAVNGNYSGTRFQKPSKTLDYWGFERGSHNGKSMADSINDSDEDDLDFLLEQTVALGDEDSNEERVRQASHTLTLRLLDSNGEIEVSTAGSINSMILSYVLTVHKSQGSEFRKVFGLFHSSHSAAVQRELLYTLITRAKEELYIICEPDRPLKKGTFTNGIVRQRIQGNTLEEKAEYFKGKVKAGEGIQ